MKLTYAALALITIFSIGATNPGQTPDTVVINENNMNPRGLNNEQLKQDAFLEKQIEEKIRILLSQMTVEEKVGQMTQITLDVVVKKASTADAEPELDLEKLNEALHRYHVGSILNVAGDKAHTLQTWHKIITQIQNTALSGRLRIPVLFGIDSIHGAHYILGATIFPQSIAMAATWNPSLSQKSGAITALETRASGIPWNFFPVLDVGRQVLWPRFYETYGEDVLLAQQMGWANILGQQGFTKNGLKENHHVASCMKHYVGYSFPWSGKDRTPAIITEKMMREYFLPTFETAVRAGAETVMINSGEVDGIPGHANYHLITEVLKGEMKFKGLAVSDWEDIKRLYTRDHYASSPEDAVRKAVMAGVDMSMVPFDYSFAEILTKLIKEQKIPINRIDDAVARILRVKLMLGLFENPYPDRAALAKIKNEEFDKENLKMASEAMTVLKNSDDILPLSSNSKILVTGPSANSLSALNGGWTITWQGNRQQLYPRNKKTIVQALRSEVSPSNISYFKGVEWSKKAQDYRASLEAAKKSDVIVYCFGEPTYTETPGNIDDLSLDPVQIEYAKELYKTGKPVIFVLTEGRPRIIRDIEMSASAILLAYLPGMEGGVAIAKTLTGKVNPSGKLPFTYPRFVNSLIPYDHKYQEVADGNKYNPQWPFGFGLSYSKFTYKNLRLNKNQIDINNGVRVSVQLTNKSAIPGQEVVQLYVSDLYRSFSSPPVKKLADFKKVSLEPFETKTVEFEINLNQLSFVGPTNQRIVEKGKFKIQIGDLTDEFNF